MCTNKAKSAVGIYISSANRSQTYSSVKPGAVQSEPPSDSFDSPMQLEFFVPDRLS